jgi:hypothetical protein
VMFMTWPHAAVPEARPDPFDRLRRRKGDHDLDPAKFPQVLWDQPGVRR